MLDTEPAHQRHKWICHISELLFSLKSISCLLIFLLFDFESSVWRMNLMSLRFQVFRNLKYERLTVDQRNNPILWNITMKYAPHIRKYSNEISTQLYEMSQWNKPILWNATMRYPPNIMKYHNEISTLYYEMSQWNKPILWNLAMKYAPYIMKCHNEISTQYYEIQQ